VAVSGEDGGGCFGAVATRHRNNPSLGGVRRQPPAGNGENGRGQLKLGETPEANHRPVQFRFVQHLFSLARLVVDRTDVVVGDGVDMRGAGKGRRQPFRIVKVPIAHFSSPSPELPQSLRTAGDEDHLFRRETLHQLFGHELAEHSEAPVRMMFMRSPILESVKCPNAEDPTARQDPQQPTEEMGRAVRAASRDTGSEAVHWTEHRSRISALLSRRPTPMHKQDRELSEGGIGEFDARGHASHRQRLAGREDEVARHIAARYRDEIVDYRVAYKAVSADARKMPPPWRRPSPTTAPVSA
jgi:hypothetical protein